VSAIWLQFAGCVAIWGFSWIAITTQIAVVAPAWGACYRFLLAGLVFVAIALVRRLTLRLSLRDHLFAFGYGLFQFALNFWFVYESERHITSGLVAVVFALMAVTNPLTARVLLGQRVRPSIWLGAALAIPGVTLMFWPEINQLSFTDAGLFGLMLALIGMVSATLGNQFPASAHGRRMSPFVLNTWGMLYGSAASALYASIMAGPPTFDTGWRFLGGLLFLALIASVLAFTLYLNVIRTLGVAVAGYVGVLVPIVALLLSTLFEDYVWTLPAVLGAALALGGTLLAVSGASFTRSRQSRT
jgi:drug/metabolite transporter (DMT)-like permease